MVRSPSNPVLQRVSSKTSLESVVSVKSSKSEQGVTVTDIEPRSQGYVKGHKKSHSDTSMFSNIGTKLFKSVMAVSKRTFSTSDNESIDSSLVEPNSEGSSTHNNAMNSEMKRDSSFGSFDNLSLADVDQQGNAQKVAKSSIEQNGYRLPTMGSSLPGSSSKSQKSVLPPSVQSNSVTAEKVPVTKTNSSDLGESSVHRPLHHSLSTSALRSKQQSQGGSSPSISG